MTTLWLALLLTGCARIDRTITVNSEPDNALVYLNDQEIGRTPVTRTFKWYGTYDVEVRKDGYETIKTSAPVIAPWWQIPPIDLIAEFYPGKLEDNRSFQYSLREPTTVEEDPMALINRGEQLKTRLESGQRHGSSPDTSDDPPGPSSVYQACSGDESGAVKFGEFHARSRFSSITTRRRDAFRPSGHRLRNPGTFKNLRRISFRRRGVGCFPRDHGRIEIDRSAL